MMGRTEEQFAEAYAKAEWFTGFHRKSVWLIPTEDGYIISVVRPNQIDIPHGSSAVRYNEQMHITDHVEGSIQ